MSRRILVTSALPYANGSIHLGHLVEYLYTDMWVRYLKMRGHEAYYFCADDTHGTPIEIRARKEGVPPETVIARFHAEHTRDFKDFHITFDQYHSTHSPENRAWATRIFEALKDKGHIERRAVEQTYCEHDGLWLPDRYVRGTCPSCGAPDQYGDVCEACNTHYRPTELKDPRCAICGTPPVRKSSEHLFFRLSALAEPLRRWVSEANHLQPEAARYVLGWLDQGLRDWDITRDGPYFGFPIPGETNKYFYVWLDAPIGYIASSQKWCDERGLDIARFWSDPNTEIYHFIGKDILYFHTLFWPACLLDAGLNLPSAVVVHGFLSVEGQKMSKSRGTFITARAYLDHLDPQYLRYYYASKLTAGIVDLDLSFADFTNRVNAELVNKIANLASRSLKFLGKRFGGRLGQIPADGAALLAAARAFVPAIEAAYERRDLASAIENIVRIADLGNGYLQEKEPFKVVASDPERARDITTAAVNVSRLIAILLAPVLPGLAADLATVLGEGPYTWADLERDLVDRATGPFEHLIERVDPARVEALMEALKTEAAPAAPAAPPAESYTVEPLQGEITIDEFARADLRVARVVTAETVPGADRLLRLGLDLGPLGPREVLAGIRLAFPDPQALVGRLLVCVANLKPRQMKFGTSHGMILAAGEPPRLALIEPGPAARPGERIH